jgi:(1->4)-alpha-D-glucan 1-alpha-D-glucosylmutase
MLEELRKQQSARPRQLLREILSGWHDGRVKLYLTDRALDFRHLHAEAYADGGYLPIGSLGARSANICAFARVKETQWCITVAPRLTTQLAAASRMPFGKAVWQDTALLLPPKAPDVWQNALTGESISATTDTGGKRTLLLADLIKHFPVALLSPKE